MVSGEDPGVANWLDSGGFTEGTLDCSRCVPVGCSGGDEAPAITSLAALDRQMTEVYQAAWAKTNAADTQTLVTAQRAWVKVRNDCWKAADVTACVQGAYRNRISELQARYRLLTPVGSARYQCPGPPPQEATADYFETDPPTALVTWPTTSPAWSNTSSPTPISPSAANTCRRRGVCEPRDSMRATSSCPT